MRLDHITTSWLEVDELNQSPKASPDLKFFEVFKQTPFELYAQEMILQEWPEEQRELCTQRFTAVLSRIVRNW